MRPLSVAFVGGASGDWQVQQHSVIVGGPLDQVTGVSLVEGEAALAPAGQDAAWTLRGVTSNQRYVTRAEHDQLFARRARLGRPEATLAAFIPMSKSEVWWELTQDERRSIFEDRSRHVAVTLDYMPAIARRLHHSRDLGEPFDFLTWFEYAPADAGAFDELVGLLRATEEWSYVEREVDIRLSREPGQG